VSLEAGYNINRLADYGRTSVEMIERHYAGYLRDETPEEILRLGGQPAAPRSVRAHWVHLHGRHNFSQGTPSPSPSSRVRPHSWR